MKSIRYFIGILLVFAVGLFVFGGAVRAQEAKASTIVSVSKDTTVDQTVFYTGQDITIDGIVNGDVFCAGQNITINGTVNGDVFCAGQNITVRGMVTGSARLAGQNTTLLGKVTGNISMAGAMIEIAHGGVAGRDVHVGGNSLLINGTVVRDLTSGARTVTLNGSVGRNANIRDEALMISPSAHIGGTLTYRSTQPAEIAAGTVTGSITKLEPQQPRAINSAKVVLLGYGYWFISFLIIAFVALLLFPRALSNGATHTNERPWQTLLAGFVAVVAPPIVIMLVALTFVGIPLAILLGLLYVLALAMSGPFFAFFVGTKFLPERRPAVRMLLGSALILITYAIPVIGFIVGTLVVFFGTGMFAMVVMERMPKSRVATTSHTKK